MGKKTAIKKEVVTISPDTQILRLTSEVKSQAEDIHSLNQRIDKIIEMHEKCKSLRGI